MRRESPGQETIFAPRSVLSQDVSTDPWLKSAPLRAGKGALQTRTAQTDKFCYRPSPYFGGNAQPLRLKAAEIGVVFPLCRSFESRSRIISILTKPSSPTLSDAPEAQDDWKQTLARYRQASNARAAWQIVSTLLPFAFLSWLMWRSLEVSYWYTLLLSIPQAGLLVRLFVLHHDCSHGSLFRSRRVNNAVGTLLGLLVLTPFLSWKREHILHHVTTGDLERRGHGDVFTLTVAEYIRLTPLQRLGYRLFRHPLFLFFLAPLAYFAILQRQTFTVPRRWTRERVNIWLTDLVLLVIGGVLLWGLGWKTLLLLFIPANLLASAAGVWLFHVQHAYRDAYWRDHAEWSYFDSGFQGSSHYDLPQVLHWFTANIGFHHLHHLDSHIPNYRLQECQRENPQLAAPNKLTLLQSLDSLWWVLWDEPGQRMIRFSELPESVEWKAVSP